MMLLATAVLILSCTLTTFSDAANSYNLALLQETLEVIGEDLVMFVTNKLNGGKTDEEKDDPLYESTDEQPGDIEAEGEDGGDEEAQDEEEDETEEQEATSGDNSIESQSTGKRKKTKTLQGDSSEESQSVGEKNKKKPKRLKSDSSDESQTIVEKKKTKRLQDVARATRGGNKKFAERKGKRKENLKTKDAECEDQKIINAENKPSDKKVVLNENKASTTEKITKKPKKLIQDITENNSGGNGKTDDTDENPAEEEDNDKHTEEGSDENTKDDENNAEEPDGNEEEEPDMAVSLASVAVNMAADKLKEQLGKFNLQLK